MAKAHPQPTMDDLIDRPPVPHRTVRAPRLLWFALLFCPIGGVALRILVAVHWPSPARPDEVFQNIEPAYRLWTGLGVVTWEWRDGIRSWLFPGFLSGLMQSTALLHWPATLALPIVWSVLSLLCGATIALAVLIGWRVQGALAALFCGVLAAVWPDLVYFGPKTLGEVQAGNLLALAAGLLVLAPPGRLSLARLVGVGVLLGLVFDLRFQLAPTLLIVAVWAARGNARAWRALLLGVAVPTLAMGALDWVSWGTPFQSVWKNVWVNLVQHKAVIYGSEPAGWYLAELVRRFGAAIVPLGYGAYRGARRAPLLAWVAVSVVLFHSLISHKEYSFIYAALPPFLLLAGIGLAELLAAIPALQIVPRRALLPLTLVLVITAGAVSVAEPPVKDSDSFHGLAEAWRVLRGRSDLCGIGLLGDPAPWQLTPGYAGLQRDVPIVLVDGLGALPAAQAGFNYLVAPGTDGPNLTGFEPVSCSSGWCVFHRPQQCQPVADDTINASLARRGL